MVDLTDGCVLGDQLAFTATELGHVTEQHERAVVVLRRPQWDDPRDDRRF